MAGNPWQAEILARHHYQALLQEAEQVRLLRFLKEGGEGKQNRLRMSPWLKLQAAWLSLWARLS